MKEKRGGSDISRGEQKVMWGYLAGHLFLLYAHCLSFCFASLFQLVSVSNVMIIVFSLLTNLFTAC